MNIFGAMYDKTMQWSKHRFAVFWFGQTTSRATCVDAFDGTAYYHFYQGPCLPRATVQQRRRHTKLPQR